MPLVEHPLTAKIAFTGRMRPAESSRKPLRAASRRSAWNWAASRRTSFSRTAAMDDAVNGAVSASLPRPGQTLHRRLAPAVAGIHPRCLRDKLLALAKTARMGNPMSLETQVGPVTTRPQYDKVLSYIDVAKNEGAKLRMGGGPATRPECGNGWFVEPTHFHRA